MHYSTRDQTIARSLTLLLIVCVSRKISTFQPRRLLNFYQVYNRYKYTRCNSSISMQQPLLMLYRDGTLVPLIVSSRPHHYCACMHAGYRCLPPIHFVFTPCSQRSLPPSHDITMSRCHTRTQMLLYRNSTPFDLPRRFRANLLEIEVLVYLYTLDGE